MLVLFMLMPFQPLILRIANATTRPVLHRVEYHIDMDKYYLPILIHGYFTAVICVTSIVAADSIFLIFVQHVCGLFIITGWVVTAPHGRKSDEGPLALLNIILLSSKLANKTSDTGGIPHRRCQSSNCKRYGLSKYGTMYSRPQNSFKVCTDLQFQSSYNPTTRDVWTLCSFWNENSAGKIVLCECRI